MIKHNLYDVLFGDKDLPNEIKDLREREALYKLMESYLAPSRQLKNHLLLTPGNMSDTIFFIEHGSARGFFYGEDGEEKLLYMWNDNSIVIDSLSYFFSKPTTMFIQLTQDSQLLSLSRSDIAKITQEFPSLEMIINIILENDMEYNRKRLVDFMTLTPAARYQKLLESMPKANLDFSQKDIALFTGTSRQTVYRAKKK